MKCLHCLVEFHPEKVEIELESDADGRWFIKRYLCPACNRANLYLTNLVDVFRTGTRVKSEVAIHPMSSGRPPCPAEVPADIAEDYTEACAVLPHSPKASAALSRRCLQNLLREAAGVKPGNLAQEIQQVLDSGALPSHLATSVDAIRHVGNFAAHPIKDTSTGVVTPVETGEAGWNLDVLEGLFDFYYVQPTVTARKKAALDAKLQAAGKNPMK